MQYRRADALLPEIPVIDCDEGGAVRLFDVSAAGARRLSAIARRTLTPPVVGWLDWRSRKWVARNDSPYVPEIVQIAERLPGAGVHALNLSYEWTCTTAAVAPLMVRGLAAITGASAAGAATSLTEAAVIGWLLSMRYLAGAVFGREVVAERQDPDDWLASATDVPAAVRERLHAMFRHYDRHGSPGDATVLAGLLGRAPRDLDNYLRAHLD